MNMKSILLASTAVIALSASAYAADKETYNSDIKIEKYSNGNYKEKDVVTKTDTAGTTNKSEKILKVSVDSKGNIDKSKTVETIVDPKGLGNKHTVIVKDTEKTQDGQVTTSHTKTVDGKNTEGTKDNYATSSKVTQDSAGNYAEKDVTTNTDADGTAVSFEKDANVVVSANGDVDKSTTTKNVTDPKGLDNKTVVKTSNTEKTQDGTVATSQAVTVDGKVVASQTKTVPQQ